VIVYSTQVILRVLNEHGIVGFTPKEAMTFSELVTTLIKEMEAKKGMKKSKILDVDGLFVCQKCKGSMGTFNALLTKAGEVEFTWNRAKKKYDVGYQETALLVKVEIACPFCKKPVGKVVVDEFRRQRGM
jgi:hypothetical protein